MYGALIEAILGPLPYVTGKACMRCASVTPYCVIHNYYYYYDFSVSVICS